LFYEGQEFDLKPDSTTLVTILTACAHSNMTDEAWYIFSNIEKMYNIKPEHSHYGCIVYAFGRAGDLDMAENIILNGTGPDVL